MGSKAILKLISILGIETNDEFESFVENFDMQLIGNIPTENNNILPDENGNIIFNTTLNIIPISLKNNDFKIKNRIRNTSNSNGSNINKKNNDNFKDNQLFIGELKELIAQDKLKQAIDKLLQKFNEEDNKDAINMIIVQAGALTQLELQVTNNVITNENAKIDRAKISSALLKIIDEKII